MRALFFYNLIGIILYRRSVYYVINHVQGLRVLFMCNTIANTIEPITKNAKYILSIFLFKEPPSVRIERPFTIVYFSYRVNYFFHIIKKIMRGQHSR